MAPPEYILCNEPIYYFFLSFVGSVLLFEASGDMQKRFTKERLFALSYLMASKRLVCVIISLVVILQLPSKTPPRH